MFPFSAVPKRPSKPMSNWKVSISYRSAEIIAGLLPGKHKHLDDDANRAVIEFFGQVLRTRTRIAAEQEQEQDPDI
jgi:hypothetical protein